VGRFFGVVLALALAVGFAGRASAATPNTWTALGPSAAQVLALAASPEAPGVINAVSGSRVWRSTDSGATWAPASSELAGLTQSLAVNPGDGNALVAGSGNCSVWVSSDAGATWSQPPTGFGTIPSCEPLLAWSPSGLFALARGTLYTSLNGGLAWSEVGAPPDGYFARALVVLPTAPATLYVATESGTVRRSTDGGLTWSNRSAGLPTSVPDSPLPPGVNRLAVDPADTDVLYAEVDGVGLYRTDDGGGLWEPIVPPTESAPPLVFPITLATTPTTLIAVEGFTAFRSTDGGASWTPAAKSPGGLGSGFATGFFADPSDPNALYMSAFGVYRSLDAGDTFAYSGTGLDKAVVHSLAPVAGAPGSYLAATEGIGVQRTDDGGESWRVANDGVVGQTLQLAAHPSDGDVFYLIAGGHLWKTTNGGVSWATSDAGIPYGANSVAVDPSSPAKVYTGITWWETGASTVYRSADGGASWTGSALPAGAGSLRRLAVDPTNGDRVYAGTSDGLFRSSDGGQTWQQLYASYVYDVVVTADGDAYVAGDSVVLRFGPTSPASAPASAGLADIVRTLAEDAVDPQTLYAGTTNGVYQSVDGGGRWAKLATSGLDSPLITDVRAIAPRQLMVATARGTATIGLVPPAADAANASDVTATSARFTGSGVPAGSSASAFFEYGPTASYGSTTAETNLGAGSDPVTVIANVSGLSSATTYHYRLVVRSGGGIAVTADATFTTGGTPAPAPSTLTLGASVGSTGAQVTGSVNPNGALTTYWFEYGTTTSFGAQTTTTSAGAGSSPVPVEAVLTGLSQATTYHYRLVAQNSGGTSLGTSRQFTTASPPVTPPTAATGNATVGTPTQATVRGSVNPNGAATDYWFEYGTTTSYGQQTPVKSAGSGAGTVAVEAELTGLAPGTQYHYRLVAENAGGRSFGFDRQLSTLSLPPPLPLPSAATMGTVAAPVLRTGRLLRGTVPLALSWTATAGSAAICSYEVHRRSNTAPPIQIATADGPELASSSLPATGLSYLVRAHGCDGLVSAFAESPRVDLRLLQETTGALRRGPGWRRVSAPSASAGFVLRTRRPGARATLSFSGSSVALIATKGRGYGAVSVSLDGGPETRIDLRSARSRMQQVVYILNLPSSGAHKLLIRAHAVGSRRPVDLDAFAVVD
jgi:photosystem II stability/assembly factor-like uncharacterized protein